MLFFIYINMYTVHVLEMAAIYFLFYFNGLLIRSVNGCWLARISTQSVLFFFQENIQANNKCSMSPTQSRSAGYIPDLSPFLNNFKRDSQGFIETPER
jgi:hypothetical protein